MIALNNCKKISSKNNNARLLNDCVRKIETIGIEFQASREKAQRQTGLAVMRQETLNGTRLRTKPKP